MPKAKCKAKGKAKGMPKAHPKVKAAAAQKKPKEPAAKKEKGKKAGLI